MASMLAVMSCARLGSQWISPGSTVTISTIPTAVMRDGAEMDGIIEDLWRINHRPHVTINNISMNRVWYRNSYDISSETYIITVIPPRNLTVKMIKSVNISCKSDRRGYLLCSTSFANAYLVVTTARSGPG